MRFTSLLVVTMTAGSFITSALSVLGPFLLTDLAISRTRLGTLFSVMFASATLVSPAVGRLIDSQGGPRSLVALFSLQAVAIAGIVAAPSWAWLVVAMAVAGLPMAAMNPLTNHLVSEHVPLEQQGLLMGIKQSGGQVNWFVAGVLLPPLALVAGWRAALAIGAVFGLLGLLLGRGLTHTQPQGREPLPPVGTETARAATRSVRWLAVYAFVMTLGISSISTYMPLYAFERLGYSEAAAGWLTATVGVVGVVARILWGRHADRFGRPSRLLALLALASAVSQAGIWLAEPVGAWLMWPAAAATGATSAAWATVAMIALVRGAPRELVGRVSGVMLFGGHAALFVAPILFGTVVDQQAGSYHVAWIGVTVAFLSGAVLAAARHVREARADDHGVVLDELAT